jgi:hypothetical protein
MNQKSELKLLYKQAQLPIFQNWMYDTEADAKACPKGDVRLVEDQSSGLVYNAGFRPELMTYDAAAARATFSKCCWPRLRHHRF